MSETCETVKVESPESPGGYMVINKSDLAPEHVVFGKKKANSNKDSGGKE